MSSASNNLPLVERWRDWYNHDVKRMVMESYAPDCKVYPMGLGVFEGHEHFLKVELAVLAKAPKRTFDIERMHVAGDVVCVEATLRDPDQGAAWALPFIAVLTFRDGKIMTDRTYSDWSRWPGL